MYKGEQTSSTYCDVQTMVRVIVQVTAYGGRERALPRMSTEHFLLCAQSAPVAVAIIFRSKSNYDQFGFARIRMNIKRFALKFGARCMGCVPISPVARQHCLFNRAHVRYWRFHYIFIVRIRFCLRRFSLHWCSDFNFG